MGAKTSLVLAALFFGVCVWNVGMAVADEPQDVEIGEGEEWAEWNWTPDNPERPRYYYAAGTGRAPLFPNAICFNTACKGSKFWIPGVGDWCDTTSNNSAWMCTAKGNGCDPLPPGQGGQMVFCRGTWRFAGGTCSVGNGTCR